MPQSDINSVEELIGRAQQKESALDSRTKALIKLKIGEHRSKIVKFVFGVYSVVVGASVLYLLYRGLWCHDDVFASFTELLKIAVIPIVTLVIGYYFGSLKSEQQ